MLQGEHSAILLNFVKLQVVINTFVLSIFEWLFYSGFNVIITQDQTAQTGKACANKTKLCSGLASRVYIVNEFTVDMQSPNKQE